MPARRLPGLGVRVRRARRTDLEAVRALLGRPVRPAEQRFDRRVVTDLGSDVYLAEDDGSAVVGVVGVFYLRSLASGRWRAVLDVLRARDEPLAAALVAFAEERARGRGCTTLEAWPARDDDPLVPAVVARGWRPAPPAHVVSLEGPT